jgi:hypothetical protein
MDYSTLNNREKIERKREEKRRKKENYNINCCKLMNLFTKETDDYLGLGR